MLYLAGCKWTTGEGARLMQEPPIDRYRPLKKGFLTNDLTHIYDAIDGAVQEYGIMRFAEKAQVDRTTLYRTFHTRQTRPSLDTMVSVLRVLGVRLTVERLTEWDGHQDHLEVFDALAAARFLTAAFKTGSHKRINKAFLKLLGLQDNVSALARRNVTSRENLYRAFAYPRVPRFSTALAFLNAVGLKFSVEQMQRVKKRNS